MMCQSCGMPLSKDPQGGGTNVDGSKSSMYCSYCYQNGAFTAPDITAVQMQEFVVAKLKEMHYPGFIAKFFAKSIPSLERWKNVSVSAAPVAPAIETAVPPVYTPASDSIVSNVPEAPIVSPRDESASGTGDKESA